MTITLKELQEKRLSIAAKIKEIGQRAGDAGFENAEDQAAWDAVNADYAANMESLDKANRGEQISQRMAEIERDDSVAVRPNFLNKSERLARENDPLVGIGRSERGVLALRGWCLASSGYSASSKEVAAMREFGVESNHREIEIAGWDTARYRNAQRHWQLNHQSRAMDSYLAATMTTTGGSGADGGKAIPAETFLERLEINMLAFGGVRQVAEMIVTDHGNSLVWPTVDDTAQSAAIVAEGATVDASGAGGTNPTFAQRTWTAYKYGSGTALITQELIEDSAFDLATVLGDLLGERIARGTNAAFTTGTGSSAPTGIAHTTTTLGVTAASATVIAPDEVIALAHSIDPAYRGTGRTGWMCNDNVIKILRQMKDTTNQYLWQPGLQAGVPDRLYGFPIYFNQAMTATPATTTTVLVFGDLSSYKIRRVRNVRFYRMDERYRDFDKTGFVAFVREDGKLLTSGTARVKRLTMA